MLIMKEKGIEKLYIAAAIISTAAFGMTAPVFAYEETAEAATEQVSEVEMPEAGAEIEVVTEDQELPEVEIDADEAAENEETQVVVEETQILIEADTEANDVQEAEKINDEIEIPAWLTEEEHDRLLFFRTPEEYRADLENITNRLAAAKDELEQAKLSQDESLIAAAEENLHLVKVDAYWIVKYMPPVYYEPPVREDIQGNKNQNDVLSDKLTDDDQAEEKTEIPETLKADAETSEQTVEIVEIAEVQETKLLSTPQTGDNAPIAEVMLVMIGSMAVLTYELKKRYSK